MLEEMLKNSLFNRGGDQCWELFLAPIKSKFYERESKFPHKKLDLQDKKLKFVIKIQYSEIKTLKF